MAKKFQNKYRIETTRAQWWNYSWDGLYFITICSHDRECLFGEIENAELRPTQIGQIVLEEWHRSFDIRQELFCEAFVLMPNHLHAILRIDNPVPAADTHGRAYLRRAYQPGGVATAHRNPFRHLLPGSNHRPPNGSMNTATRRSSPFGNPGFMTTSFGMQPSTSVLRITSWLTPPNGRRTNFGGDLKPQSLLHLMVDFGRLEGKLDDY